MKEPAENDTSRRNFMKTVVPACAAAYFLNGSTFAFAQTAGKSAEQNKHMFDRKMDQEFTYTNYYAGYYREFMRLAKSLEKEWGKEKLIAFLKKNTKERWIQRGKDQAKDFGDNSLAAYVKQFRPPAFKNLLTYKIVEDTETAFQIEVTECIWAKTFRDADMADIGSAHICYGDYFWAEGFNPKIKMERDKTLMHGHECCNHRYVFMS